MTNQHKQKRQKTTHKDEKTYFWNKDKFVHISGGKTVDLGRNINLYSFLKKDHFFLTKNKFVHTSEKGPLFDGK